MLKKSILAASSLLVVGLTGTVAQANTSTSPVTETVVNGITFFTPPVGFDPLTASNADLEKYHLPPRPTDTAGLAMWEKAMSHVRWKVPDNVIPLKTEASPLKEVKSSARATSSNVTSWNWSGLVSPQAYQSVVGQWNMPWAGDPQGKLPAYSCTWVGLGGTSNDILVQAGTESDINSNGSGNYYMWVEGFDTSKLPPQPGALNSGYQMKLSDSSWQPKPGDQFWVRCDFTPATSTTPAQGTFWLEDISTGVGYDGAYSVADVPTGTAPQSAEWITERTKEGSTYPYLAGFGQINWSQCQVSKDKHTFDSPQVYGSYNGYAMWNKASTIEMAHYGDFTTVSDGSQGFGDYFDNQGTQDPA